MADGGQPIGFITAESAHTGAVAELYKHVYIDGVEKSVEKVNKTTYRSSPRTIIVGSRRNPALSAESSGSGCDTGRGACQRDACLLRGEDAVGKEPERMKVGKVSETILKRSIFKQIHTKREEVILGAGVGEDCAAVKLKPGEVFVLSTDPITGTVKRCGNAGDPDYRK